MMRTLLSRSILTSLWMLLLLLATATSPQAETPDRKPKRIVSLAPSTTEILFELKLGGNVVGVTRYCDYPSSVTTIARVGGFMDPNYEEIVALEPDLTILLTSHHDVRCELEKMRIRTLVTPHETIKDIHESIRLIGETCGAPDLAARLLNDLDRRAETVRRDVGKQPRPRVMICIGRDTESGQLTGMYMAGRNNFYDEIIEAAGGVNACTDETVAYPQLSAEGVIQVDPEVIIDLVSHIKPGGKTIDEIARQWDRLRPVNAVRRRRVHVIVGNHALRPGPRYIQFLEQLSRQLHPKPANKDTTNE